MFGNPSLITRIAVGKTAGLVIGLAGFFLLPVLDPNAGLLMRWGILLWYTTLGAIIGIFGVFNWHPILKLPMPWWFRAPFMGAWMNFVLTFFAYDNLGQVMTAIFGVDGIVTSPFWFTLEGTIVGLIIGFLATRFGGEGRETVPA
ncbi:hypothetical protein [Pelagibius sp. Alg239-R121]|uniref:hypothetical protein n=1 Tax=Pelagibius sp. Alg239-R121 TaxID=2993448 RepID=UPI0024A65A28|nr:hypothetical protein [Pelagibius sp. Alg239-R121]